MCSDDDTSAPASPARPSPPRRLSSPSLHNSPPPHLSSPSNVRGGHVVDDNNDVFGGDEGDEDDECEDDEHESFEPYNSEDERAVSSLITNYNIIRKQV